MVSRIFEYIIHLSPYDDYSPLLSYESKMRESLRDSDFLQMITPIPAGNTARACLNKGKPGPVDLMQLCLLKRGAFP